MDEGRFPYRQLLSLARAVSCLGLKCNGTQRLHTWHRSAPSILILTFDSIKDSGVIPCIAFLTEFYFYIAVLIGSFLRILSTSKSRSSCIINMPAVPRLYF